MRNKRTVFLFHTLYSIALVRVANLGSALLTFPLCPGLSLSTASSLVLEQRNRKPKDFQGIFLSFIFITLSYVHADVSMSGYVHMRAGISGGQKPHIPLRAGVKAVVSPATWVLGTELGFS